MREAVIRKHGLIAVLFSIAIILAGIVMPARAFAADSGIPDGYKPFEYNNVPHAQMRNVFETETVEVPPIRVIEVKEEGSEPVKTDPGETISFRIFNTTTQEDFEIETITDETGKCFLPAMSLKKGHDYIFFVEDHNYRYPRGARYPANSKPYVQVLAGDEPQATDGPGAYDYMTDKLWYSKLETINVERREEQCENTFEENRFDTDIDSPIYVYYGSRKMAGVDFRLVSDREIIEAASDSSGRFSAKLIEGVTYMVYVDSDKYTMDSFPLVVKDKSEYSEGIHCVNHTNCVQVKSINLYDKGEKAFGGGERVTSVRSLKDRTTVSGMNFRNQLIIDRALDTEVEALSGSDYDVFDVTAINPRRWEISKLVGTDFRIKHDIPAGKQAAHVYLVEGGNTVELPFTQFVEGGKNRVEFVTDNISLSSYAIEYGTANISGAVCKVPNATYTGKALQPAVTVSLWGAALKKGADYNLTYSNNLKVGMASVRITGCGAYEGSKTLNFRVDPKGTTLSKLTAGKKRATVKWKKQSAQTTGYKIQYSTDKKFKKGVRTYTVKSSKKTKATIKKLKSKKRYYFRICTYKKISGTTYSSGWSKVKNVRVR